MSDNSGFDNGSYHDSRCTGPYCDCDDRRYKHHSNSSSFGWIWVVVAIAIGLICPPIGAIIMWIWVFS